MKNLVIGHNAERKRPLSFPAKASGRCWQYLLRCSEDWGRYKNVFKINLTKCPHSLIPTNTRYGPTRFILKDWSLFLWIFISYAFSLLNDFWHLSFNIWVLYKHRYVVLHGGFLYSWLWVLSVWVASGTEPHRNKTGALCWSRKVPYFFYYSVCI